VCGPGSPPNMESLPPRPCPVTEALVPIASMDQSLSPNLDSVVPTSLSDYQLEPHHEEQMRCDSPMDCSDVMIEGCAPFRVS